MIINTSTKRVNLKRNLQLSLWDFCSLVVVKYIGAATALYYMTSWLASNFYQLDASLSSKLIGYAVAVSGGGAIYLLLLVVTGEGKRIYKIFKR
jgi:hypothetical protein